MSIGCQIQLDRNLEQSVVYIQFQRCNQSVQAALNRHIDGDSRFQPLQAAAGNIQTAADTAVIGSRFEGRIKYPVNDLLLYLSNLKSIFVPINKHGTQGKDNARMLEEAFASDDQIITFPAGLCSRKIGGKIQDLEWKKSFIQKAVQYKRDIVPVYFDGKNSNFFYNLARIRKALGIKMNYEMIYLQDEMFRSKHKTFRIYFGKPIPWQTFDNSKKPAEWAEWIKNKVYKLKD